MRIRRGGGCWSRLCGRVRRCAPGAGCRSPRMSRGTWGTATRTGRGIRGRSTATAIGLRRRTVRGGSCLPMAPTAFPSMGRTVSVARGSGLRGGDAGGSFTKPLDHAANTQSPSHPPRARSARPLRDHLLPGRCENAVTSEPATTKLPLLSTSSPSRCASVSSSNSPGETRPFSSIAGSRERIRPERR